MKPSDLAKKKREKEGVQEYQRNTYTPPDGFYETYKAATKKEDDWRKAAIERLTPVALTPPTKSGPTYLEKLAENRANAQKLSARVPATASVPDNIRELIFGKPIEAGTVNPRISAADFSTRYDGMTDREKAVYSHLKNTNAKDADEYLKAIDMDINQRNAEKRVADARKIAEENTAAGLYARFMGNNVVSNGAASAYELWQGLRNQPVDPNHPLLAGQDIVKGQNEAFVGDSTGIERYLREGAMGAFDFGTNLMTAGAAGLRGQALQNMVKGSFAAQAFAGSAHDAAEREGAGMQSVLTGTASAALATIIEGVGLDRLAEIGKLANARGVLKSMARSILPEAAEEAVEEAGNILADAVIMGDKNEIVNLYNTARANGATQNDAMMGALGAAGKQIGESAIIGGISGGMIGGGVAMTNRALGGNVLENDVPDTNVGNTESVAKPTFTTQNHSQNPVTVRETAISEELINSSDEMKTQPTEVQKKQAQDRDNYLERYYHENGANILRTEAEKRGSLQEAEDIYRPYYTAGLTGQAFDSVKGAMAVNADRSVAMEMYQAGASDKAADMTARIKGQDKLRRSETGVNLMTEAITDQQKALANLIAKVGRMNVTIVDTLGKDGKVGNNGEYTRGTNEVVIALDAESFSGTLFHETVHYIKQANAKGYERMAEAVFRMAAEMDGVSVSDYLRRYESMEAYGPAIEAGAYNFADVTEELVADAFQMLAADEARCRSLIAELEQSNPTVLEQIKEFLQKMLETLEGLVKDGRFHAFAEDINKDIENTKKLQKIFAEELREAGKTAETKKQPEEQTGSKKFSLIGWTKDGTEVYETSDETKGLTWAQRKQKALNMLENEYKGRVAKFWVGNNAYYAMFEKGDLNKNLYGDNKSDAKGRDAKVNAIADGDMFELVENAKYRKSKAETGKNNKNHKGVLSWDYFAKTVQIDNVVFDVVINVRKKPGGEFVYNIQLNENKNKTAEPPQKRAYSRRSEMATPKNGVHSAVGNSVAQQNANDNSEALENSGVQIDAETQSAAPKKFSRRTWEGSDYVTERNKAAKEMAEKLGITQKKAKAYIDAVNGVAKMIADNPNILDYESNEFASAFVSNSEYGGSIDFSTICKKRRWMTGTLSAIQKALPNTALTAEEVLDIRNRMKEKGYEVSCGLCYVEGSRTKMGEFTSKFIELYKRDNPPYVPTMAEMNTPEGLAKMMKEHPEVYDAYEYFYNHYGKLRPDDKALFASQQKPKLYQLATEYQGEVLDKFKDADGIELKNKNGGLRLQSFSDFEVIHLIDAMQVITDMARVGLAGQAYTKVPDFAWALGDTGLKINLSLIAKEVDENGRLILDEVEGMPRKDAEALRNRYSDNVGTIIVVFNDEQLYAAMKDDFIDFIIPFHRSQWKKSQYPAMGLPAKVKDYTYQQNEKLIKKTYHEWRGKMVLDKPTNYMPNEYWDFTKSGKENAENYLQMCAENNKRPKFYKLLKNNGNGSYSLQDDGSTDGYWKLLIDFKMYNNEGKGVPQGAVRPEFNMDEAYRMLQEYGGDHAQFPVAQEVVDEFVAEKQDTKFSVRESGEAELRRENASLQSENKHLQKMVENLKHQFELTDGTTPDQKSVRSVARAWLKQIESKADLDDFAMKLGKITEYFAKAESKNDREHAMAALRVLVRDAMEQAEALNTEMRDEYSGLIKQIRNATLKVTDELRSELENYGGYNTIRRENFSRMNLSAKGKTSINSFYYDLCQEYPEFFREEDAADEAEQLMNIIAVLDTLKPVAENPYGYDIEEYVYDETMGLLDKMAGIQMEQTFADKKKADKNAALQKLREEFKGEKQKMRDNAKLAKEKYEKELDGKWLAERMYSGRKQLEAAAKYQRLKDRNKANADKRKRSAYRKSAEKTLRELLNWMRKPNEKGHVQEAYLPLIGVLTKIETDRKDIGLKQADVVSIVSKLDALEREGYASDITDAVRNIANNFEDYFKEGMILEDMTAEQMKVLRDFIKGVKMVIVDNNKAKAMEQIERISDLGDDVIDKADNSKNVKATGRVRALADFFGLELLTPNVFFKGITDSVHNNLYKGLRIAHEQKAAMVNEAMTFINEESRLRDRAKWERDKVREFAVSNGQKAYLTVPQIMSLYCHMKREQSRVHIVGGEIKQINGETRAVQAGGIQIEPYDGKWTGLKNRKAAEAAMKQTERIMVTEEDVKTITDTLTDQQKKLADAIQKFFSTVAAGWGNATSMLMWGYRNFLEPNYFPIESSEDYMVREYGVDADGRPVKQLKNLGFTHNTVTGANNPIIIRDIFSVFATHIDQMASYAAFVPILSDMQKFMNYKQYEQVGVTEKNKPIWKLKTSTKEALKVFMGLKAEGYINDLMRQINMAAGRDDTSSFPVQMTRRMKIAAVGANLRVMAQQPTSIVRAAAVMNPLYLLNPANTAIPADYRMMYKYAPISLWKKWGGADMDTGRTMKQMLTGGNWYDKTVDISMWGAGAMDARTWGRIWKACVQETKANNPKLEGEELYLKAGQRFADVIDETQVVDTPLHRTAIMRKDSALMKMATSFMSEPLKTYNMLFDAARNLYQNPKDAKAYGKFVTTSFVLFLNAVAVSAAAGLVDAMRDDDEDDEFWDKWMKAFRGDYSEVVTKKDFAMAALTSNLGDNMNPVAMIPFVKDVWSIIQGYDVERADVTWMADMVNWSKNMMKFMEGDSKFTMQGMMKNTAENFSKMLGVPAKSLIRELESIENTYVNHIIKVDDADRIEEQISKKARTHRMGSEENLDYYIEKIVKLHFVGNDSLGASYANKLVESGIDSDKVKDRIDSALKDRCKAEPAAMEAAEAWLAKDYTAMESKLDELQDMGYSGEVAQSAMTSLYNKMVGEDDEPSAEEIKDPFDGDDVDYKKIYRADLKDAYENGGNTERVENQLRSLGLEDKDINDIYRDRISDMFDKANSNGNTTEMERLIDEYVKYNGRESTLRNRIK